MKGSAITASAVFAAAAQAVDGVVQWDIAKRHDIPRLNKRASAFTEEISNEAATGGYFATCTVGSPGQKLTLQLDTGSSDIWVPSIKSSQCSKRSNGGCPYGSFDSSASNSFTVVGAGAFDISYVDGSGSKGDYFTDAFEIAGASLTNVTMGLGKSTDIPFGLVGVGYASNEAIVSDSQSLDSAYPNLPVAMVQEGLIKTNAYSLWLNDLDSSSCQILFGGIDVDKYHGDLTRIQVYKDSNSGTFTSFMVALTSLSATSPSGSDTLTSTGFPIPVVLDSGTTLSYLPQDLAEQVWREVGAVYDQSFGAALLPCSMQTSKGYFSFGFAGPSGPSINITMDELVLDINTVRNPTFPSGQYQGQEACQLGIQNFTSEPYLLGDTFLRSAYVVYDLVNNEIGIAATDFNATTSNVVAFASSGAPIPSATEAPNQSQVNNKPAATSPAYAAASGFTGSKANAASITLTLDLSGLAVMALATGFTLLGSGVFLW